MITYTFDNDKFLVVLSGNSDDAELIKEIEMKLNVTNARYSTYPQNFFPRLLKDNLNQEVDLDGNITLCVQSPSRQGMAEVLGVLEDRFSATFDARKNQFLIIDKSTTSLSTLSKGSVALKSQYDKI